MLDREVIVAYAQKQVRWLGPLKAEGTLLEMMSSVPHEELRDHPLVYRPVNQPQDEPLRYHGVLRSTTIRYEGKKVPIRVLVGKSRPKAKLDSERRQTYLDRLTNRLTQIQAMLNTHRYKRRDCTWAQIEKAPGGNPPKRLVQGNRILLIPSLLRAKVRPL